MPIGRVIVAALVIGGTILVTPPGDLAAQSWPDATPATSDVAAGAATAADRPTLPQPSFDGLRLQEADRLVPYGLWAEWSPLLVTTPDGGAWAFFSAQTRRPAGPGPLRLYAARFDPSRGAWLPASAVPGGEVQFGPTAAVDRAGTVHLVYSDRARDAADAFSSLLYTRSTAAGGWETPVPVAADPSAGHQMMPSLAIDGSDRLHLLWRDQRNVAADQRAASAANADVFLSDLVDGAWTTPIRVNDRSEPDLNAAWPHLAVDGDRLVAVWSVYRGTTPTELEKPAARVEWSARPLAGGDWARPAPIVQRQEGEIGGLLLDVAADPRGGTVLVYGRSFRNDDQPTVDLFLRRLEGGADRWGEDIPLASGDFGYFPSLAVGSDGTAYVAFNHGHNRAVEVGAFAIGADAERPGEIQVPTAGEEGEHGRASLALSADGRAWLVYMHGTSESNVIELRGARALALPR